MAGEIRFENGERVVEKWDKVFTAISAEPRRQIIVSLLEKEEGQPISLPEMAMNPNIPLDPDVLRTELIHHHLPHLEQRDFVQWEREPLRAYRGPDYDEVAVVFEVLHTEASELPDSLVFGCQRLEAERQFEI